MMRTATVGSGGGGGGGACPVLLICRAISVSGTSVTAVAEICIPFRRPNASVSCPWIMNFWPLGILNCWFFPSSMVRMTETGGYVEHGAGHSLCRCDQFRRRRRDRGPLHGHARFELMNIELFAINSDGHTVRNIVEISESPIFRLDYDVISGNVDHRATLGLTTFVAGPLDTDVEVCTCAFVPSAKAVHNTPVPSRLHRIIRIKLDGSSFHSLLVGWIIFVIRALIGSLFRWAGIPK